MKSRNASSHYIAPSLFALFACGLSVIGPHAAPAQSLSPDVGAAWRRAGAKIQDSKKAKIATVTLYERTKVPFAKLLDPEGPFILEVRSRFLMPDDYKELARFKTLHQLILNSGHELEVKDGKVLPRAESDLKGIGALADLADLRTLKLESMNPTDAAYAELATLKKLRKIDLIGTRLSDASLAHLGKLSELAVFDTTGNFMDSEFKTVTAAGFKGLAAAPKLREIRLSSFPLDDEGCKHLATMKNLQSLTVWDTHFHGVTVGDEGLRCLAGAPKLKHIDFGVRRSRITDDGVKHLTNLKELTSLDLRYSEVTDEGAKHLGGMKQLKRLDLSATAISNAGLQHLKGLTNLEYLDLRGNGSLTSAGLKHLHELKNLKALELQGTKMYGTPAREVVLAELRKALPDCTIETKPSYGDP